MTDEDYEREIAALRALPLSQRAAAAAQHVETMMPVLPLDSAEWFNRFVAMLQTALNGPDSDERLAAFLTAIHRTLAEPDSFVAWVNQRGFGKVDLSQPNFRLFAWILVFSTQQSEPR
ncbi:MAG: hypothetical protein AAGA48_03520 [Myxococcota bacterium]